MATVVLVVLLLVLVAGTIAAIPYARAALARHRLARATQRGATDLGRSDLPDAAKTIVPGALPEPRAVVLVHGILGFDQIKLPGLRLDYFRGVARHLDACGVVVHTVRLPPLGSVPERARALADFINALPLGTARVDVIAHSLGGLDARWAIAHLGLSARVASLVTIGTPHHGTPLANLASRGPLDIARRVIRTAGLDTAALDWLTTDALERFNREVPDAAGVRYGCIVAGARTTALSLPVALLPVHAYLRLVAGANDGLVPVASQKWGEVLGEVEADHWAQVGWHATIRPVFDANTFYADLIARLQQRTLPAPAAAAPLLLPAPAKP